MISKAVIILSNTTIFNQDIREWSRMNKIDKAREKTRMFSKDNGEKSRILWQPLARQNIWQKLTVYRYNDIVRKSLLTLLLQKHIAKIFRMDIAWESDPFILTKDSFIPISYIGSIYTLNTTAKAPLKVTSF